jgi:hypothetical protein
MDSIAYSKKLSTSFVYFFERANGKTLFVGLSDKYEEAKKVKKGSVITVKHLGTNKYGTLQYPKFYRERTDVKWDEINT